MNFSKMFEILLLELESDSTIRRRQAAFKLESYAKQFNSDHIKAIRHHYGVEQDTEARFYLGKLLEKPSVQCSATSCEPTKIPLEKRRKVVASLPKYVEIDKSKVLTDWLDFETEPEIIVCLLKRIKKVESQRTVTRVESLLNHSWSSIRDMALQILAKSNFDYILDKIPEFLKSKDVFLRMQAIKLLEKHLPREASKLINKFLLSEDVDTKISALQASFTFDFQHIALAIRHILVTDNNKLVLQLACLLAINNPDPKMAVSIYKAAANSSSEKGKLLIKLAKKIIDAAKVTGQFSKNIPADVYLNKVVSHEAKKFAKSAKPDLEAKGSELNAKCELNVARAKKQINSSSSKEVCDAVSFLAQNSPEDLFLNFQSLLKHTDPRVKLRTQSVIKKLDPNLLKSELRILLKSKRKDLRLKGVRLSYLVVPDISMPLLVELYENEMSSEILSAIKPQFYNNPSLELLRILMVQEPVSEKARNDKSALISEVYKHLESISYTRLPKLEELARQCSPSSKLEASKSDKLKKSIKNVYRPPFDENFSFSWRKYFSKVIDFFGLPVAEYPRVAVFAIVCTLVFGYLASHSTEPGDIPLSKVEDSFTHSESEIIKGKIVAVNPEAVIFKTDKGIIRIVGNDFSHVQPGEVRFATVKPAESVSSDRHHVVKLSGWVDNKDKNEF